MGEESPELDAINQHIHILRRGLEALKAEATLPNPGLPQQRINDLERMLADLDDALQRYLQPIGVLRASEERFRLLVAAVEDYAIFMLDPHGNVLSWNQGAQRIKGYSEEEIIGQHFSRFYPPQDIAAGKPATVLNVAAQWGHYAEEGWRVRKNGSRFWASVLITALQDETGRLRGFGKVTRDLTERKVAEEALRQSEERFRLLVEGVRTYAICMLDHGGYITSWNTGAQMIKGYTANEIVGKHFSTFYLPDDVKSGKPEWALSVARSEGRFEEEGWRLRKDGRPFWANVLLTALYDASGQFRGYAKITRDLTERKLAEEERELLQSRERELERERERREQVEAAVTLRDQFFALVSHELKTPLTTILGNTQLQQRRLAANPHVGEAEQQRSQTIAYQVLRLQRLVNSLLDLTRMQEGQFSLHLEPLNIVALIQRLVDEIRPTLIRHQFELRLLSMPVLIQGDRDRLEQVLQNLVQNAIKYSPEGGQIGVELEVDETRVCLSISDPGIGIPEDEIPMIFERFYRASNVERSQLSGMGIGLYLAREIVALHGGTIEVTSKRGAGSRFFVYLPLG